MNNYILGILVVLIVVIIVYHYYQSRSRLLKRRTYRPIPRPVVNHNSGGGGHSSGGNAHTSHHSLMNNIDFIPSNQFEGLKKGFVFKTGEYGLGYYYDNFYLK